MSQDLPIPRQDDRSDGAAVLEWGSGEAKPRGRTAGTLAGLARDRRVPGVLAGLGAVAAAASMVGEWLVMTLPDGGADGETELRIPGNVSEVGGFGVGYLVGLLLLGALAALALSGTTAIRHNARVAGLAVAAGLVALLVATAFALDEPSQRALFYSPEDGYQVEYGRGLVMAFVGCLLLAAALHLSGRGQARPAADRPDEPTEPTADDGPPDAGFRPWRRGRSDRAADEDALPAPPDLTVQPTVPFARPEPPA
ncbi:hypothetical protein [Micromonospora sp. SH-82]|uniref:hypothetical protein n=1 Tax=Micromonospora sp. SH-82 TaxID=3132938 RepID=UPI003EBB9BD5